MTNNIDYKNPPGAAPGSGSPPQGGQPATGAAGGAGPAPAGGWQPRSGGWVDQMNPFDPRRKSVGLASFLSLMPGLGQIYVGFYQRGFTHAVLVASVIAILSQNIPDFLYPLLGFFLPFFWLYNIIDAGRRAALYNQALEEGKPFEFPKDAIPVAGGSLAGGAVLIVVGTVLLGYTRFGFSLDWLEEWWPLAPILIGVWLVARAALDRANQNAPGTPRGE